MAQTPSLMTIVITGSRKYQHLDRVTKVIDNLPEGTNIIVGDAHGVDTRVMEMCERVGLRYTVYPAQWEVYQKSAGIKRNLEMLNTCPRLILAFWDGESRGTKFMIDVALKRRIDLRVYFDF